MGLLDRVSGKMAEPAFAKVESGADGEKAWAQPPFWTVPDDLVAGGGSWSVSGRGVEKIDPSYRSFIELAFKASPPVFAAIRFRMNVLSEARFQWRQFVSGRPGELFGSSELSLLENPWPGGTTSDLISRMEVVSSLAGNYYGTLADDEGRLGRAARGNRRIVHMAPDRTTIVIDSASGDPNALDAQVVGYIYKPLASGVREPEEVVLLPEDVCHFAPIPDPAARFRGMSWLTPGIEEIRGDTSATLHKSKFFSNGATPNMAIVLGSDVKPVDFNRWVSLFKQSHQGVDKAYKTLFLAGGADIRPLTSDFRQIDFKPLQGLSETRIASLAGIHPTVLGFSEGLQGSSLNEGNFNASTRLAANATLRPWWRNAAASLQTLLVPPLGGAQLWYDDRDIPFLHDDAQDLATIRQANATTLNTLIAAGWKPDAAVEYLMSDDLARLRGQHSGLYSVQLQQPGADQPGANAQTPPTPGA
jgi:hypothetical protein